MELKSPMIGYSSLYRRKVPKLVRLSFQKPSVPVLGDVGCALTRRTSWDPAVIVQAGTADPVRGKMLSEALRMGASV